MLFHLFLYPLPCDKAHHFKWWYHWMMMTQNYHPVCSPSFAIAMLLTTYSSLFLGTCMPSLKYQIRYLSSEPSLFSSSEPVTVKVLSTLTRNLMGLLYPCQSNPETLLKLLSNVLKWIYKQRKILKQPNPALQWKIWTLSNIAWYVENTLMTILAFLTSNSAVTGHNGTFLSP